VVLSDRAAALRAWEEAWNSLAGVGGGDCDDHDRDDAPSVFWQKRKPDLRIALPPWPSLSWPYSPRVKYILANISEPDPPLEYQFDSGGMHGLLDEEDRFSFGPWFIGATRDGLHVRASYSYLDLRGCLGEVGGGGRGRWGGLRDGDGNGDVGAEYDRVFWTVIKIPLWNVVTFVLSTEQDLTVVISCVCISTIDFVISVNLIVWEQYAQNRRAPGGVGCEEDDGDDLFGAATVALPGWDAAPMCQSASDAVVCEGRHCVSLDAGTSTWRLSATLHRTWSDRLQFKHAILGRMEDRINHTCEFFSSIDSGDKL